MLRLSTCMAKPQNLFDFAMLAVAIPSVLRGRVLDPRTRCRHAPNTAHQDAADVHDHRNMELDSTGIPDQLRLGRFVVGESDLRERKRQGLRLRAEGPLLSVARHVWNRDPSRRTLTNQLSDLLAHVQSGTSAPRTFPARTSRPTPLGA